VINFSCSKCGKSFSVPAKYGGRRFKCPKCANILFIPKLENAHSAANQKNLKDTDNSNSVSFISNVSQEKKTDNQSDMKCPNCGFGNIKGASFCSNCGKELVAEIICDNCGAKLEPNARFCGECGASLAKRGTRIDTPTVYQKSNQFRRKSPGLAALLGFLFGGFGLMYVSVKKGLITLAVLVIIGLITGGAGAVILWLGCAVYGYFLAIKWNKDHGLV